ncbi:GDP-mannose pyrophosphatase NudK [Pseudovibrio axinellae]|uniref:GDP-mannose pyrophosphatase n=1 Tax=Pseudovibrio axinellae TaxID=989403 RepID=A0A165YV40_9HYPH|nr:NUDIX hydrolase [Pseudovibrio axinellae]KZL19261.1 GDP-mannose pyrophosphatase NudK [Pseudovibrio axinellae]SEQ43786.1 nudix-type nucleoside diphosphatase, YffH/AdpP family [Pseudovibrio axinellae]
MPELIRRTSLFESKGRIEDVEVRVVHEDGREHITTDPVWVYGDSIAVLAYDPQAKTVLLVKQLRVAPYIMEEIVILEACAGGIEASDPSIEDACKREAQEELGCELRNLRKVANVFINPARLAERAHLFLAEFTSAALNIEGRNQDEDEDIEVVELSFKELCALHAAQEIRCPRLLMLTQALMIEKASHQLA